MRPDPLDPGVAELRELDEAFDREHGRKRQNVKRRRRQPEVLGDAHFDITRWRLPARWRNDKRVGDAAIAKMTRGCDPARFEELTA
jgi:hypothetical protein